MTKLTRQVAVHALVVAGAEHLRENSDLTGLEVGWSEVWVAGDRGGNQ